MHLENRTKEGKQGNREAKGKRTGVRKEGKTIEPNSEKACIILRTRRPSGGKRAKEPKPETGGGGCAWRKLGLGRSSKKEHKGNALASGAEEGRDKLREASGSCT